MDTSHFSRVFAICGILGRPLLLLALLGCMTTSLLAYAEAPLLHISPNNRYLQDDQNQPFYMVGDSPQAILNKLTPSQAADYFQRRAAQGFNTVFIHDFIRYGFIGPNDASGNPPFDAYLPGTYIFDITKPNATYWQNLETIVKLAGQYGMEIIFDVYDNKNPEFTQFTSPNPPANLVAYGQFLARRFINYDYIIWMVGGDDYLGNHAGNISILSVIHGIRQFDQRHLGFVMDQWDAQNFDNRDLRPYLALNGIYHFDAGPWRNRYLAAYDRPDFGPIFNVESFYEGNATEPYLREEHYTFLLSGATGDLFGNRDLWQFKSNWRTVLNSQGSREMSIFGHFVRTIPWHTLTPDQNGTVFQDVGKPADYSGAYASHNLAIGYKPSTGTGSRTFTVNMNYFNAPVTAKWFDPTNGLYIDIGTGFPHSGTKTFGTPTTNSTGKDNDFVLVLTSGTLSPHAQ